MNKTIKRNVVVSALLAIMLCVSLIAGATFALFTSESKTNVAVTSGKVDVVATMNGLTLYSPTSIDQSGNVVDSANAATATTFANGGTATADDNTITLENMVAGDKVTFDLVITNYSTVAVKFKTTYTSTGDDELIEALDISVGNTTGWVSLAAAAEGGSVVNTLNCYVEMPCDANVQGMSCTLSFLVEAVQGNVDVVEDENIVYISNADEFVAFANSFVEDVNDQYKDKTVYLTNDIDLTGRTDFNGIGFRHSKAPEGDFHGTFDGQNHTVKNFEISNGEWEYSTAGLFNGIGAYGIVKNVKVDNATINSTHYAGGIAGVSYGTIENCEVTNTTIKSTATLIGGNYDNGDKVGGIVGYMYEDSATKNCSVANTTIMAYRDLAAIAGYANARATVTGCTIGENVSVQVDRSHNYKNYTQASQYDAGNFVGEAYAVSNVTTGNTGNATILNADYYIYTADELFGVATNFNGNPNYYNNKTIQLVNDIDLENRAWTPIGTSAIQFRGTLDGNGKAIKNLKITEAAGVADNDGVGLFGWLGCNASSMGYVKNLTIDEAEVIGSAYVGTIVGYLQFGAVENCTVKNAKVTATHKNINRCGDKAGALIGFVASNGEYTKVSNCNAEDCKVTAARDAAQLIGYGYAGSKFVNLSANNVTVTAEVGECEHLNANIVSSQALIGNGTSNGLDRSNILSE